MTVLDDDAPGITVAGVFAAMGFGLSGPAGYSCVADSRDLQRPAVRVSPARQLAPGFAVA